MFLDIISKIFIFVAIHAMIIFIIKSHIAVIKTSLKYFDFRFIKHDIEIIPYFTQGGEKEEELSKEKFFELLKQNKIKELNYLCFLFFGLFCEEEYEYFCKVKE
ncbi:hypothetical protein FW696_05425 [Campylobacter coli]|uniref:hypothetical protein n=1 Tax=Campylobacter coli TaxID=195 RepID=UPI001387727B|nr:hypothetical protein [Campylobacter coli]EDO6579310.1 hypothetical protein [Campylobacter coli]EDO6977423.1 hypothetical protein [Campylobacter coli]